MGFIHRLEKRNGEKGLVEKYRPTLEPYQWEPLLKFRKDYIKDQEEMRSYQKIAAGLRDFDTARFFGHEAARHMKLYRACCLLIGWYGGYDSPKDCPEINPWGWPDSLFEELGLVENRCTLSTT